MLCAAAMLLPPAVTLATQPARGSGEPRFGILLVVSDDPPPRLGETFRIHVAAGSSQSLRDAIGIVKLTVPKGFEVVKGDTKRKVHPSNNWMGKQDARWDLYLRPTRLGRSQIRGSILISRGSSRRWDESECALDIDVRSDTVITPRASRALRYERVTDGSRFRYGYEHMVLISEPEPWIRDLRGERTEAIPISSPAAVCVGCGLKAPAEVNLVVTVGVDGEVKWIEPRAASQASDDPRVLASAEAVLQKWRFQPYRVGDRPIANWVAVRVQVLPESK